MNKHLSLAKKLTEKLELPMKVFSIEENEEGILTFHFSAESRVDLRDLVKKLQEGTERKIIMHQVGPREEARLLAGVGPCGLRLCCATFLKTFPAFTVGDFNEVKSGGEIGPCGKKICCLVFEEKKTTTEKETSEKPIPKEPILEKKEKIAPPKRILRVLPHKRPRHRR